MLERTSYTLSIWVYIFSQIYIGCLYNDAKHIYLENLAAALSQTNIKSTLKYVVVYRNGFSLPEVSSIFQQNGFNIGKFNFLNLNYMNYAIKSPSL